MEESITKIQDFDDFNDKEFKQICENLKNPPGIPDPADPALIICQNPFVFGAKSLKRTKFVSKAVWYYLLIGRTLSTAYIHCNNVIKDFVFQIKSLDDRKDEDELDVPKVSKAPKVTQWSEPFIDFTHRVIGVRAAPLAYVIREDSAVPVNYPPILTNQPHSGMHGLVEMELMVRFTHIPLVFRDDNKKIYHS